MPGRHRASGGDEERWGGTLSAVIPILHDDSLVTEPLLKLLGLQKHLPPALSALGLHLVAARLLERDGMISASDVEEMRGFLLAGETWDAVTHAELDVLFALNERAADAGHHGSWSDLFLKACVHFLMSARGFSILSRPVALACDRRLQEASAAVSPLMADDLEALLTTGLRALWAGVAQVAASSSDDIGWLAVRIGRDGRFRANELVLLHLLNDEYADLHPALRTLLDTAA